MMYRKQLLSLAIIWRICLVYAGTPVLKIPLKDFQWQACMIGTQLVDENAYSDGITENGQDLTLTLLDSQYLPVKRNALYVQYNNGQRKLYFVPVNSTHPHEKIYTMRLKNSNGDINNDSFKFTVVDTYNVRQRRYIISIVALMNSPNAYATDVEKLFAFEAKLYMFYQNVLGITSKSFYLFDYVITDNTIQIDVQDCSFLQGANDCNREKKFGIKKDLCQTIMAVEDTCVPKAALADFMKPEFELQSLKLQPYEPQICLGNSNPMLNTEAMGKTMLFSNIFPVPGLFVLNMTRDESWIDEGMVSDDVLDLYVVRINPTTFYPVTHWAYVINFRGMTKATDVYHRLYVCVTDDTWNELHADNSLKLMVAGFDYQYFSGEVFNMELKFNLIQSGQLQQPLHWYYVTFTFSFFNTQQSDVWAFHMNFFLNALIDYFGRTTYGSLMYLRSFNLDGGADANRNGLKSGTVVWGIDLRENCNFELLRKTRAMMFTAVGSQDIKAEFISGMASVLTLTTIQETYAGKCSLTPPTKTDTIPALEFSFCGMNTYQIPETAFTDAEDGSTRQLSLKLVNPIGDAALDSTSWVQFNKSTQTIQALATEDVEKKTYAFKLIVTDKSGLQVQCDIQIQITEDVPDVTFYIETRGLFKATPLPPTFALWKVVNQWLTNIGYAGDDFRLLRNEKTSTEQNFLTFTSCSFRSTPCDAVKIQTYINYFFQANKVVQPLFSESLAPYFSQVVVNWYEQGVCLIKNKPTIANSWGPLQVSTCQTFSQLVPENTFSDIEQGNTRKLKVIVSLPNGDLLPTWISFDESAQKLSMIASEEQTPSTIDLEMTVTDIDNLVAVQTLVVNKDVSTTDPSHLITMTFTLQDSSINSYVKLYTELRVKIRSYLGESDNTPSVEYDQLSPYPSSLYTVKWSDCRLSKTNCESEKYNNLKEELVTNMNAFKQHLSPAFQVDSVTLVESGICKDEKTPPQVQNTIPPQKITYCSFYTYKVGENIFTDIIDGSTENLKLSLTNMDGSEVARDNLATINPNAQEITMLLTSTPAKQSSYTYLLKAQNSRGLTATTNFQINIEDSPKELKSYMRVLASSNYYTDTKFTTTEVNTYFLGKFAAAYNWPVTNVHVYELTNGPTYVIAKLTTCGAQTCTPPFENYDQSKFNGEFIVEQPEYERSENCVGKPPIVMQSPVSFTVQRCQAFSKTISEEVFRDDDGLDNLDFLVTQINGKYITQGSSWLTMEQRTIKGILPYEVLKNTASQKFNLTIRATNLYLKYVETSVIMTVEGTLPQIFYKYEMSLNIIGESPGSLSNQISTTNVVNQFFGGNYVNIIEYTSTSTSNFKLVWSVCNLPNRCQAEGLTASSSLIYNSGNAGLGISSSFSAVFTSVNLQLVSVLEVMGDQAKGPIFNSPVSAYNPYVLKLDYCGGFKYLLDENLFSDVEDGKTRNLQLRLEVAGNDISLKYSWLYLSSEQYIIGMPLYSDAKATYQISLVAKDSCGLEATVTLELSFNLPSPPQFYYRMYYETKVKATVDNRFIFMQKLAQYLGDAHTTSIGLLNMQTTRVTYFNCSVSYQPCDFYTLNHTLYRFMNQENQPLEPFKAALQPPFDINYVKMIVQGSCLEQNPPVVVNPLPTTVIHLCGWSMYQIPEDTFYDYDEGYTRNLKLLFDTTHNFVQFDATNSVQTVYLFPTANLMQAQSIYTFQVTATDQDALKISTQWKVEIQGPYSLLQECQIILELQRGTMKHNTILESVLYIVQRLEAYFSITQDEIGIVNFYETSTAFYFSFSYCSSTYKQYTTNSPDHKLDYIGLQRKILMKLFYDDRVTYNANFKTAFESYFTVSTVTTQFSNRCANLPPIPLIQQITIDIGYGGYYFHEYLNNYFYDFHDGWAYDLKLYMTTVSGIALHLDNWVNVDVMSRRIIAVIYDAIRNDATTRYEFYLVVMDSISQKTQISVFLQKNDVVYNTPIPYYINYYFSFTGVSSTIYATQSAYIVDTVLSYFQSVTTRISVLVKYYQKSFGYSQYRVFTFTIAFDTCDSQVLSQITQIYTDDGNLQASILSSITDQTYQLNRINYVTSCNPPPDPPQIVEPIPSQTLEYCTVFSYTVPANLFVDQVEGNTRILNLDLLSADKSALPVSTWIQINSATQVITAIPIQSVFTSQSTYKFNLQASNSGDLKSVTDLSVSISEQPYTADCTIHVLLEYKYELHNFYQLDVLRRFVEMTSAYYGDVTVQKLKIIDFVRLETSYKIVWSYCAFMFQTQQEALAGLTESHRAQITQIFSKFTSVENIINTQYSAYMSEYFNLLQVVGNYDCIEEPPQANTNEYVVDAKFCEMFSDRIDENAFNDKRDGGTRQLTLKLTWENGNELPPDHWLQINSEQYVYGVLTPQVVQAANEYRYKVVATDSSGRSSSITYIVRTPSVAKTFQVYFRTGFTMGSTNQNTATIVYNFVNKLSQYLDPDDTTGKIYVRRFDFPNSIEWSHCSLEECTANKVAQIFRKMTTTLLQPVPQFVSAMQTVGITPYSTRMNIEDRQCSKGVDNGTTTNPPGPINPPTCFYEFALYQIPEPTFIDLMGRNTRAFYLNLYNHDGNALAQSSWLQFNAAAQTIYAYTVLSQMQQSQLYRLEGRHPVTGIVSRLTLDFQLLDYQVLNNVKDELCYFTTELKVGYNAMYNDISIVDLFMAQLASFFQTTKESILIYSFQRGVMQGSWFSFSFTWTNCTLTSAFIQSSYSQTYYTQLQSQMSQMMTLTTTNTYSVTETFKKFIEENSLFRITSIQANEKCKKPANTPPKSNGDLTAKTQCGRMNYQIPQNAFTDDEDGDTRQLTLTMQRISGENYPSAPWVYMTDNQFVVGMVSDGVKDFATTYKYLVVAEDTSGGETSLTLTIEINATSFEPPIYIGFMRYTLAQTFQDDVHFQVWFLEKIEEWMSTKDVTETDLYALSDSTDGLIRFADCSACRNMGVNQLILDFTFNQVPGFGNAVILGALYNAMNPTLTPSQIGNEIENEPCETQAPRVQDFVLPVEMCQLFSWDLSTREIASMLGNTDVRLTGLNKAALADDDMIWYNSEYFVELWPREDFWTTSKISSYEYRMYDKNTGYNLGGAKQLNFENEKGELDPSNLEYTLTIKSPSTLDQPQNFYISQVFATLRESVGPKNGSGLQFVRFIKFPSENKYQVTWSNCSLTRDCTSEDYKSFVQALNEITLTDKQQVTEVESNCINVPENNNSAIHFIVPVCGMGKKEVEPDILVEGATVKLIQQDGTALLRDSWIRYEASGKKIYALPTETVVRTEGNFLYKLEISGDFTTQINVTVDVQEEEEVYYSVGISFTSLLPADTPYLDLQMKLLELLADFNNKNMSNYRVIYFQKLSSAQEKFYLKYADCSVQKVVCKAKEEEILSEEQRFMTADDQPTQQFSNALRSEKFIVSKVQRDTPVLVVNEPPVVKKLELIEVNYCQAKCVDIGSVFFDAFDDGNLQYVLLFEEDGTPVPSDYWGQLGSDETLCLYPKPDTQDITYKFVIKVTDPCGNTATTVVEVKVVRTFTGQHGYEWSFDMELKNEYTNDVQALDQVRQGVMSYLDKELKDPQQVQITSYTLDQKQLSIGFADCHLCNQEAIVGFGNALFESGNEVNNALKEAVAPNNLVKVEAGGDGRCNPNSPKCNTTKIVVKSELCDPFVYKLPVDLCEDRKGDQVLLLDKLTTNLHYTGVNGEVVSDTSWIQYEASTLTLYGYPRFGGFERNLNKRYSFYLKVFDEDGDESVVEICIDVIGEEPDVDYELTLTGYLSEQAKQSAVVEICINQQLSKYFQEPVNNIQTMKGANDYIEYRWSFCRMKSDECNCTHVEQTQQLIQDENIFSDAMSDCISEPKVTYKLHGACEEKEGPRVINGLSDVRINPGTVFSRDLPFDQFSSNLTRILVDEKGNPVDLDWLKMQEDRVCGLIDFYDFDVPGYTKDTKILHSIVAKDACGKTAVDTFYILFTDEVPTLKYRIIVFLENDYDEIVGNCTHLENIANIIAKTGDVDPDDVVIRGVLNMTGNGTQIEFGFRTIEDCDDEKAKEVIERFYIDQAGNKVFIESLLMDDYHAAKVERRGCGSNSGFPIWVIILIILLALLLLLWLLWFCIPRCCPTGCFGTCCAPCCSPGGQCSSLRAGQKSCIGPCCGGDDKYSIASSSMVDPIATLPPTPSKGQSSPTAHTLSRPNTGPPSGKDSTADSLVDPISPVKSISGAVSPTFHVSPIPGIHPTQPPTGINLGTNTDHTDNVKKEGFTQTSPPATPPIPVPPTHGHDGMKVEAWHDERNQSVYSRTVRNQHLQNTGYNQYHSERWRDQTDNQIDRRFLEYQQQQQQQQNYDQRSAFESRYARELERCQNSSYLIDQNRTKDMVDYNRTRDMVDYNSTKDFVYDSRKRDVIARDQFSKSVLENRQEYNRSNATQGRSSGINNSESALLGDSEVRSSRRHRMLKRVKPRSSEVTRFTSKYHAERLSPRKSSTKRPITVRIRRSELMKYLAKRDRRKIELDPHDLKTLLQGNARVKFANGTNQSSSERVVEYHGSRRSPRRRSVSTTSYDVTTDDVMIEGRSPRRMRSYSASSLSEAYEKRLPVERPATPTGVFLKLGDDITTSEGEEYVTYRQPKTSTDVNFTRQPTKTSQFSRRKYFTSENQRQSRRTDGGRSFEMTSRRSYKNRGYDDSNV